MSYSKVFFRLCWFCGLSIVLAEANATDAMLVWSKEPEAGRTNIMYRQRVDDDWQAPQTIYQSKEINSAPFIGSSMRSDLRNDILLVWSSLSTTRSILRYRFFIDGVWRPVDVMPDQGGEVTSPAVIFDHNGDAWLFWLSDHRDYDDLYYRRWSSLDETWSESKQVNKKNEVPDIRPSVSLNEQGDVIVIWQQYSNEVGTYVERSKVYYVQDANTDNANKGTIAEDDEQRELNRNDIALPDDFELIGRAVLHYPKNQQRRHDIIIRQ